MRQLSDNQTGWVRPSMAGLMAGLVLMLSLFASSGSLHNALHNGSTDHHGQCAVCSIHQGKLDAPPSTEVKLAAPVSIAWTLPQSDFQFVQSFDYSLTPSRGPPAVIASL